MSRDTLSLLLTSGGDMPFTLPPRQHAAWAGTCARRVVHGFCASALAVAASQALAQAPLLPDFAEPSLGAPPQAQHATGQAPQAGVAKSALTGFSVNIRSREAVRNFHNAIYSASENIAAGWTGSAAGCVAGQVSAAYQDATLRRINYFRAMAGVPATVTLDATYTRKAQQAALIMLANNALSHKPPSSWRCHTSEGEEAAGRSNLSLGMAGATSVTGQMEDEGDTNLAVGHRRWLLYPPTKVMGAGHAVNDSTSVSVVWVLDGPHSTRPTVRDDFVSWPPPGYVPQTLVFPRWSFSYPDADFSQARVEMRSGGHNISLRLEPYQAFMGDNTLVWVPNARPNAASADVSYEVQVRNVRIQGVARDFHYTVTAINPDRYGADTVLPALTAQGGGAYAITPVPGATGYQWAAFSLRDFTQTEGAEAGMGLLQPNVSGYSPRDTRVKASGSASFHLAHPIPQRLQMLTFTPQFYVQPGAQLQFASQLGWATPTQRALVQVSLDGKSWQTIHSQAGSGGAGEQSFQRKTVSLSAFAHKSIQLRFAYEHQSGTYYPQSDVGVGWYIDDIQLTNVAQRSDQALQNTNAPSFRHQPTGSERQFLVARALMHGYPLEWGPALEVKSNGGPGPLPPGLDPNDPAVQDAQKLYLSFYQRPSDPAGLIYWAKTIKREGLSTPMLQGFANSEESKRLYGDINHNTIGNVLDKIYQALFGVLPDAAGKAYYVNEFRQGRMTAASITLNVLNGAQNADAQAVRNKLEAAKLFTLVIDPELDEKNPQARYAGPADEVAARAWLAREATSVKRVTAAQARQFVRETIADPGDPIKSP
ncbi:DUF4214 domain-containing protein [Allofranklinella schreckenbergeri]|uniref:DUF4214 domain-containing protein n=1 Tax=Allofranklinella schreckenbergeri TaxID=1076744 RepID=A0A3M6QF14_9BURK|nr:CAP domain-containing protein [Allofranklinella schreckenbergeri]RMX01039.1 DUF4214 domain-containing protein [Allofranklinella schreckenbergeri]